MARKSLSNAAGCNGSNVTFDRLAAAAAIAFLTKAVPLENPEAWRAFRNRFERSSSSLVRVVIAGEMIGAARKSTR